MTLLKLMSRILVSEVTMNLFTPSHKFYEGIESCFECASSCWICADASLHEGDSAQLKLTIRYCLEAAEVCAATAKELTTMNETLSEKAREQIQKCIELCSRCRDEAERHANLHEHCMIAAKCCELCVQTCQSYMEEREGAYL